MINYNIVCLAENFPTKSPEGFKSDTFDWRACEAIARAMERLARDETDIACIRLGMPIDGDDHRIMLATTIAVLVLDAQKSGS